MIAATALLAAWRSSGAGFHPLHGALFGLVTVPLAFLEFAATPRPRGLGRDGLLGAGVWALALIGLGGAYFQAPYTETLLDGGTVDDAYQSVSQIVDLMLTPKVGAGSLRHFALAIMPGLLAAFALAGSLAFLARLGAYRSAPLPVLVCGAALTTLYPIGKPVDSLSTWVGFFGGYSLVSLLLGGIGALGLLLLYWLVDRVLGSPARVDDEVPS